MESKKVEVTATFVGSDGETITVDAGRFEWQIVWGFGGGLTCAKTKKESPKENLEAGIAYLKGHKSELTRVDGGQSCGSGEVQAESRKIM